MTEPEKRLWRHLDRIPVEGTHFRRQAPTGPYVVDFVCHSAKLIIELDGGQHGRKDVAERDAARTRWLEAEGYRVLRFWNAELSANLPGVLDTIFGALYASPHPEAAGFPTPSRRTRANPPP